MMTVGLSRLFCFCFVVPFLTTTGEHLYLLVNVTQSLPRVGDGSVLLYTEQQT